MPEDFNTDIGYYGQAPKDIINFVINNAEKSCTLDKEYVCIYIDGERFYTNELESFAKVFRNYYKETEEYKYYKDIEINKYPTTIVDEPIEITTEEINLNENSISVIN